jgi:acyl phosphate:glycerol-3-phosphate acyltransferase
MNIFYLILALVLSYLLGSIPSAVWIGRKFHNIDVREHGSGNAGTSNVIRVLGWKTGIPVLMTDVAKGWLAAMLPRFFNLAAPDSVMLINLQLLAGAMAITGHIFPLFADFRGGKGVASIFGILIALQPLLTLCCIVVFLVVLLITGIVSVASMSAGLAFPIFQFLLFDSNSLFFRIFSILVAVVLLITHRENIKRLIQGKESKLIKFGKKNTKDNTTS